MTIMKIASSNVQMSASHLATQTHEVSESLNFWVGQRQRQDSGTAPQATPSTTVDLSANAQNSQSAGALNKELNDAVSKDPKLRLIMDMLQFITGRPVRLLDIADLQSTNQGGGKKKNKRKMRRRKRKRKGTNDRKKENEYLSLIHI
eukprot:TRINITY_DN23834_c0_g1_i1.p2 TRINITY_DN23834_c0_g1~~TRINITY_DN23834_c0_g1_i1.p2  ORF type:complete len:147 (-),score=4.79 TRINITY_DN23834_c0_g1_i1:85-525(-)